MYGKCSILVWSFCQDWNQAHLTKNRPRRAILGLQKKICCHFFKIFFTMRPTKRRWNQYHTCIFYMITPYQVSLNNIEIFNIIFFQILEVKTFIQCCFPYPLLVEISTCESCLVSDLKIKILPFL